MNVKVGDWIRFYQNGEFVIGEVMYIKTDYWKPHYYTDCGAVFADEVLEVRSKVEKEGGVK